MALSDDFSRGLIQKSTYIRLAIASLRHDAGDSYQVQVPLAGVSLADVFAEASLMVRNELVDVSVAPFIITWTEPELLPSFSPAAVQSMQVGGRGYLYFALGADNQSKSRIQQVDPARLYSFYKMLRPDFLAELSRLLETKTATADINILFVRWLNKSVPAAREFGSIADVVTQLRKEIGEAIAKVPPSGVTPDEFNTAFNLLTEEINERQLRGDYATITGLQEALTEIRQSLQGKQAAGDYALEDELNEAIAQLTNWIQEKQPAGNYALQQSLTDAIADFSREITTRQSSFVINAGDYGAKGDLVYRQTAHNTVAIVTGTDTTANIQAALDAAAALVPQDVNLPYEGSVRVVIPPGKYIISKTIVVPSNVILDCAHANFFNFQSNDWSPIIWGKRHSHATIINVHANKKSGIWWGDPNAGGVRCDSFIEAIRVQHAGVEYESTLPPRQQKCGLRLFGLWFSIDRIEVKEANIGLDIYQASDLLCPAVFLMGCSTACRMESAEQIVLPCVALDTNFNTGFQIDNSGNIFVTLTAFVNSDGWGTAMDCLLRVGQYSGTPCKDIYITAIAVSIGGRMLSVQNCQDSDFTLYASNARLFSQTSGNNQATSHWQAKNWTSASGQVNAGALLAHNIGTNYQPYGNEGSPTGVVKYGGNLSGFLNVNLACDSAIARIEGQVYGNLLINGNKYGVPVPRSIIRVNCGGAQYSEYGKIWAADQYVVGGGGTAVPSVLAGETDLIKSIRWGLSGYDIPLSPGVYSLNLWFIEPENQYRKFDISLQGQIWQSNFCIYDEAGMAKLLIKGFNNVAVGSTGILAIRFVPRAADVIITALEVLQ